VENGLRLRAQQARERAAAARRLPPLATSRRRQCDDDNDVIEPFPPAVFAVVNVALPDLLLYHSKDAGDLRDAK